MTDFSTEPVENTDGDNRPQEQIRSDSRLSTGESAPRQNASKPKGETTHYVHLANGHVFPVTAKELAKAHRESAPGTFHKDGVQHTVIGIYPAEVQLPEEENDDE